MKTHTLVILSNVIAELMTASRSPSQPLTINDLDAIINETGRRVARNMLNSGTTGHNMPSACLTDAINKLNSSISQAKSKKTEEPATKLQVVTAHRDRLLSSLKKAFDDTNWVWDNCHIFYHPKDSAMIEHTKKAGIFGRSRIMQHSREPRPFTHAKEKDLV